MSAQLDQPLYDEIGEILTNATAEMPDTMVRQLANILQSRAFRGIEDAAGAIDGAQFKRIESELGNLARAQQTAPDPAARALGAAIGDMRDSFRNLIARQNPAEAERIAAINQGYANLVRAERAAGGSAAVGREGVFTPGELAQAVTNMGGSRSARGRGEALMQDFASNARQVLPSQVPDSGTAGRLAGLLMGGAAVMKPVLAIPVVAAAGIYTKPAQALLNRIYRATDNPGDSRRALAELAQMARQTPALLPYYEDAARRFLPDAQSPTQEPQRAQQ